MCPRVEYELLRLVRAVEQGAEQDKVQRRIADAIAISGLPLRGPAAQVGTSASRLSAYATGKVQPSAATLLRIERVAYRR